MSLCCSIDLAENWDSNGQITLGWTANDMTNGNATFALHCMKLYDVGLTYQELMLTASSDCFTLQQGRSIPRDSLAKIELSFQIYISKIIYIFRRLINEGIFLDLVPL